MPSTLLLLWRTGLVGEADTTRHRVDELLRRRPPPGRGLVDALDSLCRVVCEDLVLLGAAATLIPSLDTHTISASSSAATRQVEDAQFAAGEGPTRDAFTARRPVLVADLAGIGLARWPGWVPVAMGAGVRAVYALPLHVGATIFGVLTLYVGRAPTLEGRRLETALVFSEIATELLLDASIRGGDQVTPDLDAALDTHSHIYQAQGMLMVDLGVSLPEALARLRAHAWATGQNLTNLAGDIVIGRVRLPRDDR